MQAVNLFQGSPPTQNPLPAYPAGRQYGISRGPDNVGLNFPPQSPWQAMYTKGFARPASMPSHAGFGFPAAGQEYFHGLVNNSAPPKPPAMVSPYTPGGVGVDFKPAAASPAARPGMAQPIQPASQGTMYGKSGSPQFFGIYAPGTDIAKLPHTDTMQPNPLYSGLRVKPVSFPKR